MGWLIFGLPPAELAVHPSDKNDVQELYLLCDNIESFVQEMAQWNISCSPLQNQSWGLLTKITPPGGGKLGVYQSRHARPKAMLIARTRIHSNKRPIKKTIRKRSRGGEEEIEYD